MAPCYFIQAISRRVMTMKPLCRGVDKEVGLWVVRDDRLLIMNTCFSCFLCSLKVVCANDDDDGWTLAQRNGGLATRFHEATTGWGHVTPGQKMHLPTARINGGGGTWPLLSLLALSLHLLPLSLLSALPPTPTPTNTTHKKELALRNAHESTLSSPLL